jgi:cyclophilin family peptidyl-prolyl cis-trans isomerase
MPMSRPASAAIRVALEIASGDDAWGTVLLELDPEKAPLSVRNFLRYVEEGFYNGTIFHRAIPGYVIQGGGYIGLTEPKTAGLQERVTNEARNQLKNQRYTIAMARGSDPHSATSQFFINLADNPKLDYPSRDGWGYAVFGRVVSGTEIVDRISNVPTQPNPQMPGENSQPVQPPMIRVARRVESEPAPVSMPAGVPQPDVGGHEPSAAAPVPGEPPVPPLEPPPQPEPDIPSER